jgi:PAS domain S-box-containing protein
MPAPDITGVDWETIGRCLGMFPDPVLVADSQGRVVFLNPAAEHLLGWSMREEHRFPTSNELLHPETEGEEDWFIKQCLRDKENVSHVPVRLRNRRGELLSLTATASPINDRAGKPGGCFVVLRRIEAEAAGHPELASQVATLQSILENHPVPFFTVGPDLVITHMNQRLEKLTGYTSEEVVNRMTCGQVLNTAHCDTHNCMLRRAMEHEQPIAGVRSVVRDREGREIPVVVNASLITDPAGRVIGGFEALRDITAMVEAEKKIEMLTEMTQEGLLMADENHRVIFVNSRMADIARRPKEQLIGLDVGSALSSQHLEMIEDLMRKADLQGHQQLQFCSTVRWGSIPTQEDRVFETCMAVCRTGKSATTCLYLRDLTERIEIERQLRKTNNFLNNIIQSSVDGIVVVDTRGNILIFNEGAERILGYRADELIGRPGALYRFYDSELAREMMRRMRSADYGPPGKLDSCRISFSDNKGEEVPVNFSAALIEEGGQEIGSVGIFSDLREHLRMRRELEEAQRQVVHAAKISSLGRLAAGVAHEINNPLAGVLIYADMLMKEIESQPQLRQDLEEIINQTLRCKQIVTRLLEFSRQSLGQRLPFHLAEIITQCVNLIKHQALFHDIQIVLDLDPDVPQIIGDPGELQQVFTNLILNAADAMHGKGRITISSQLHDETVLVKVRDTGPGIPTDLMDKLFEPFFTTKPQGKGTGLGLSVVYGVVQRHGGSIDVESSPGDGATITIKLPLESPERLAPELEM